MNKKIMLLGLAAVCASMFALPSAASANPALHISGTPKFEVKSATAGTLTRADNNNVSCTSTSGSGEFTTTTTGTVTLTFHGCKSTALGTHCQSGATTGTITTTNLVFHIITVTPGVRGIQITGLNNHFASFNCAGIPATVNGVGVLGEITSPACGTASTTAGLSFTSASAGNQTHTSFTGTTSDLSSTIAGSTQTSSIDAAATITFASSQTLTCT